MEEPPKKTCFVICPIGDDGSPERQWSNDVLDCIITPVVEKMGYQKPIRADHINESGIITRQIVDLLIDSDLVIADLSFRNPNVCYELAVRHVAKKPFIHMIKTGHKIPFDNASNRAITFDIDIRSANKAMEELKSHILSIESDKNITDNPIGTALTLRELRSSGDPSQTISADMMDAIQTLSAEVRQAIKPRLNPYRRDYPVAEVDNLWMLPALLERTRDEKQISILVKQLRDIILQLRNLKTEKASKKVIFIAEGRRLEIINQLKELGVSNTEISKLLNNEGFFNDF